MTVAVGILTILAALVPFGIWLWKRKVASDEANAPEYKRNEIDKAIADGNENDVNRLLDNAVNRTPERVREPDDRPRDSG